MSESHYDVGIDIGKRRLAYGWPAFRLAGSIDLEAPGLPRDRELRAMQRWLCRHIPSGVQLWVDQAFAGKGAVSVAQDLTETISAVLTAQDWERSPIVVHQATWKSAVLGNHMADKDEIRGWLEENEPELAAACKTEDEFDAMTIGLYGWGRTEGRILAPQPKAPKRRKARA